MNVKIDDIESAIRLILNNVKEEFGETVNVEEDYYWHITKENLYSVEKKPDEITIGSLKDDLDELNSICKQDYFPLRQNLLKTISVLRYIAEK